MVRKVILLTVLLFWPAARSFADAAGQLEQAEQLEKQGKLDEAEAIYKAVVEANPSTEAGLEAQEGLAKLYIGWEKETQAEAAYDELLSKFGGHEGLTRALDHVADAYRQKRAFDKARNVYQYIVENRRGADDAMEAQRGIVLSSMALGDDPNAESAIEKLVTEFAGHEELAETVGEIAGDYAELGRYEKARALYQYVVDTQQANEQGIWCRMAATGTDLVLLDEPNAEGSITALVSDCGADAVLGEVVGHVADLYRALIALGSERTTKGQVKILLNDMSRRDKAKVIDHIADYYRAVRKHAKAANLYESVVRNWPDLEHAIESQTSLAKLYISLEDEPNAQAAIAKLFSQFCGHEDLAEAAEHVADQYDKQGEPNRAGEIYQIALETCSALTSTAAENRRLLMWAQVGLIKTCVSDGNDAAAQAAADELLSDFNDRSDLPEATFQAAEQCFYKGKYTLAIGLWKHVFERYPQSKLRSKIPYLL
ncbi:MAG: tetratricopeptide repeat protein, partial [Planctomycetota bacterium]